MTLDLSRVIYASTANAFKNTGVYNTTLTFSGSVAAGATATFTTVLTTEEASDYVFVVAEYTNIYKKISAGDATKYWQKLPYLATAYIPTTSANLGAFIYFVVNGTTVTFTGVLFNGNVGTETITTTAINIKYVTYTS
mgnify:CR=1 FL=1